MTSFGNEPFSETAPVPLSDYAYAPAVNDPGGSHADAYQMVAIAGQALALLVVHFGFGFDVPLGPAFAVVAASLLLNLIVLTGHPRQYGWASSAAVSGVRYPAACGAFVSYRRPGESVVSVACAWRCPQQYDDPQHHRPLRLSITCITILAIWHFPLP